MKQLVKSLAYILSLSLIVFLLPINQANAAPTYIYEWVSQSGTVSNDGLAHEYTNLEAGQTIDLSLTLINRSNTTIVGKSNLISSPDKQVPVGVWGIGSQTPKQDGTPSFLDLSSFILNNNRFVYYDGPNVPDNGLITMNWTIKLKDNLSDGVYNLYVRPVSEYLAWTRQIKNGKLLPTTSSDIFWRLTVGEGDSEYLTYTNSDFGITFNYPYEYTLEVRDSYMSMAELHLSLEHNNSFIEVMVNPGGFGPIWVNIKYYLSYDHGKLEIDNRITQSCEYCDEGVDSILASIEINKDNYFFNSSWPRSGGSKEQDIVDIIKSFRFGLSD